VARQNETALAVARFLNSSPWVRSVYYPGLPDHPDYAIAKQQMAGFGGVVSFELDADAARTRRFIDALRIPAIGPSLGGTESLIVPVALASYYDCPPEQRAALGISDGLVRLAVGIEDTDDVLADLAQALEATFGARAR